MGRTAEPGEEKQPEWFVYDPVSNNVLGEGTLEEATALAAEYNALNPGKTPVEVLGWDDPVGLPGAERNKEDADA